MPLNLYPTPTQGTGTAFGAVPGVLGLPDPFGDLNKAAGGGLGPLNQNLLTNLTSESLGVISPGTRNALAITNAQRGQGSGMPLSGLSTNDLFGNIAGFSEGLQKQAADQYSSLIPTISKTQTVDPALQTEIANINALRSAAPSPTAQFNLAKSLYDQYAAKVRGPGGGISFAPQPYTPKPLDFSGGVGVGGGGVGLGAGGPTYDPSKFDWYTSTFGKPATTAGADLPWGSSVATEPTYMGPNPNAPGQGVPYTDPKTGQTYPDIYSGPGASVPVIDDALSQAFGTFGPGGFGNVGDLFSSPGAAQDIFSELF